jgi:hypothetical protein
MAMRTMKETISHKKWILGLVLSGYVIFAIVAVLRLLTDVDEWWHGRKQSF